MNEFLEAIWTPVGFALVGGYAWGLFVGWAVWAKHAGRSHR